MVKLLNVKPFRQTPRHCGPASLKMVLKYYGISKSESELARITKCDNTGTRAKNIVIAAKRLGMDAYVKDNSDITELLALIKRGIPVIVDWFSNDEGHYSVAIGTDAKNIYLQDPELGTIRRINKNTFMKIWFDFQGEYMETAKNLILRRIIVIEKK